MCATDEIHLLERKKNTHDQPPNKTKRTQTPTNYESKLVFHVYLTFSSDIRKFFVNETITDLHKSEKKPTTFTGHDLEYSHMTEFQFNVEK